MTSVLTREKLTEYLDEYYWMPEYYNRISKGYPFAVEYLELDGTESFDTWTADTLCREFWDGTVFTFVGLICSGDPNATDEEAFLVL